MSVKIISTIGPSSEKISTLRSMKKNGMDIARVNTKHGDQRQWNRIIKKLKKLELEILIDIKSEEHFDWIKTINPDYVAVSFSENVEQLKRIKKELPNVKLISKIETINGFRNFKNLLKHSSAIMVARGDLGKSISMERVPSIQRKILNYCNSSKKMSIVATEMLLSMVKNRKPTNAEVNDVYMASILKANAVMLSEETAIGENPSLSVHWMRKILDEAEKK